MLEQEIEIRTPEGVVRESSRRIDLSESLRALQVGCFSRGNLLMGIFP